MDGTMQERLELAERVCWLFGMTGVRKLLSPREKAMHEAWRAWMDRVSDDDRKKAKPALSASAIAAAARRYDQDEAKMRRASLAAVGVPADQEARDER